MSADGLPRLMSRYIELYQPQLYQLLRSALIGLTTSWRVELTLSFTTLLAGVKCVTGFKQLRARVRGGFRS